LATTAETNTETTAEFLDEISPKCVQLPEADTIAFMPASEPTRASQHRGHQLNRRERMELILERDGPYCVWCSTPLNTPLNPPTTEHLVPRIKGGPSWIENEVAACKRCNNERGHQSPAGWIHDCEGMGRTPRPDIIVAALERLQQAIAERGGQRRARPYISSQLRRLRKQY